MAKDPAERYQTAVELLEEVSTSRYRIDLAEATIG